MASKSNMTLRIEPELKEQAIDDILAEFGSAPTKKAAKQAVPAQKQPASPAPSAPLVINGVDFSEFLDNAPASRKTAAAPIPDPQPIREPVKTPEANKPPAPEKSAVTEDVPAPDTGKRFLHRRTLKTGKAGRVFKNALISADSKKFTRNEVTPKS